MLRICTNPHHDGLLPPLICENTEMVFVGESKTLRKVESRTIWGTLSERTHSVFTRDDLSNCADVHDGLLPPLSCENAQVLPAGESK